MQPEAAAHIWDASEAARAVRVFTDGKAKGDLLEDMLLRSAVERQLIHGRSRSVPGRRHTPPPATGQVTKPSERSFASRGSGVRVP
jgi:hypothetical protein